ncbi:TOPRS ligase, partial [Fregata magnificens]|nr:TOPRS ligase [Fregata magnificens]
VAAELENRCPICLDSWEEASYVLPCLHQFCYVCIKRWAESKPECPLCKRRVTSILHSVRGDDDFQEHVILPPAAALVFIHRRGGAPGHPAAHNLRRPAAASQPSAAGLVPRAPVGSLHPHVWALLFREDPALLRPMMLWLQQELWLIFEGGRGEASAARRLIVSSLHLFGLDEEALFQLLREVLGTHTRSFVHRLIETIVDRCGGEARRRVGLGDAHAAEERKGSPAAAPGPAASRGGSPAPSPGPSSSPDRSEAEELPSTSQAALLGGPGSPPSAPVPTHGEQEEPQEDPEEAVPGPSTPSWGREHSPGGPRRAPKRRASSAEATSPPNKRPPSRQ